MTYLSKNAPKDKLPETFKNTIILVIHQNEAS